MIERLGKWLLGPYDLEDTDEREEQLEERVDLVVARVDALEARVERLEKQHPHRNGTHGDH